MTHLQHTQTTHSNLQKGARPTETTRCIGGGSGEDSTQFESEGVYGTYARFEGIYDAGLERKSEGKDS